MHGHALINFFVNWIERFAEIDPIVSVPGEFHRALLCPSTPFDKSENEPLIKFAFVDLYSERIIPTSVLESRVAFCLRIYSCQTRCSP